MRKLTALLVGIFALSGCDDRDMFSLTPYREIGVYEVETDMGGADALLRGLAQQHGIERHGGLYEQPQSDPPVNKATMLTRNCMLFAEKSGTVLKLSLSAVEGKACPPLMHRSFHQARRGLAPKRRN